MSRPNPFSPQIAKSTYKLTGPKLQGFLFDMQATYAIAKYNGAFLGAFKSGEGGGGSKRTEPHAEDHAIAALDAYGSKNLYGKLLGNFTIKVSKSPCARCTDTIIALKKANPELRIRVKVLGLYLGEGASQGISGVIKLRSAGIPVRLWDVRNAYDSEDIATHGQKGRELKEFLGMKDSHFKEIEKREVRSYDVAWSDKKEYKTIFSGKELSKEAQLQIQLDSLKHERGQVGSALDGYQLRMVELKKFIQQIDDRMLAAKDMTGRFIIDMMDSHLVVKQKQGYNNYMDELDRVAQIILNLQSEQTRIEKELKELGV